MPLTTLVMDPPKGSDSAKAWDVFTEYFPAFATASQFAVVIEGPEVWPDNNMISNFTKHIEEDAYDYRNTHRDTFPPEVVTCSVGVYGDSCADYVLPMGRAFQPFVESYFVSKDRKLTFVMVVFTDPTGDSGMTPFAAEFLNDYAKHLENDVVGGFGDYQKRYGMKGYTARATGILMLGIDGETGSVDDLAKIDMIVMPTAFLIFTYYVRSVRMLLIPLCTLSLCIGGSFLFVYPIAKYSSMTFLTFVPQFMMSCCLAISLDYNLFILTRFKEGNDLGFPVFKTLTDIVVNTCGHTIAISGTLITLAWLGQMIIPCDPLIAQGLATAIATVNCIFVNVTLGPALLCVFPKFFSEPTTLHPLYRFIAYVKGRRSAKYGTISPSDDESDEGVQRTGQAKNLQGTSTGCILHCGETSASYYEELKEGKTATELRDEAAQKQAQNTWYKIAKFVQKYSIFVIVGVLAVGAPFYSRVPEIKTSTDPFEFVPRDAPSVIAWRDLSKNFPPGQLIPYYIITEFTYTSRSDNGAEVGALNSSLGYQMLNDLVHGMMTETCLKDYNHGSATGILTGVMQAIHTDYTWLCYPPQDPDPLAWDGTITWDYLHSPEHGLYDNSSDFEPIERRWACQAAYDGLYSVMMTHDARATFIAMLSPFEPLGSVSSTWMDQFAKVQKKIEKKYTRTFVVDDGEEVGTQSQSVIALPDENTEVPYTLKVYLAGGNTIPRDYNALIDKYMVPMLLGIIGVVSFVIFIAFRSIVTPIRMALTICYTVATTFGFAYYVYQTDSFHWLFPYLKDYDGDAFMWIVPTCAMAITACLGMDYDVFLTTRIYEYRTTLRYTSQGSIVKGLTKTGSIITGAGVIMCVAFFGLILSDVVALNQFGVILCFSVLLDTFVVRSLFVPATMFLFNELNWWPRNVDEGLYDEDDFVDDIPELNQAPPEDTST